MDTALSLGSVEGNKLRSAYHGWTYGADGACPSIPACHGAHVPRPARLSRTQARAGVHADRPQGPEAGDRTMLDFNDVVIGQDRPVVESQRPEQLPFDLTAERHVRGPDKVSVEYRRWLVELAAELVPATVSSAATSPAGGR